MNEDHRLESEADGAEEIHNLSKKGDYLELQKEENLETNRD